MALTSLSVALAVLFGSLACALPTQTSAISQPSVILDKATVIGKANGTVNQFLGLPYAQPPYVSVFNVDPSL